MAKTEKAAAPATDSKFAGFLASKKLDARRVVGASAKLETLQPADRAIRLAARQKRAGDGAKTPAAADAKKPRSGRPITPRALAAALSGKSVSGPVKTRFLRAVNHLLAQKKQEPVTLDLLF